MIKYSAACKQMFPSVKGTEEAERVSEVIFDLWRKRKSLVLTELCDPRADLEELRKELKNRSTTKMQRLRRAVSELARVIEMLPKSPPVELSVFHEGWMEGDDDVANKKRRRRVYSNLINLAHDHLTGGTKPDDRPLRCDGDCGCLWQCGPVSNRGGSARRVPCARTELEHAPIYSRQEIEHVSSCSYRLFADDPHTFQEIEGDTDKMRFTWIFCVSSSSIA